MAETNEKTKTRTREIIEAWKPRILFLLSLIHISEPTRPY